MGSFEHFKLQIGSQNIPRSRDVIKGEGDMDIDPHNKLYFINCFLPIG